MLQKRTIVGRKLVLLPVLDVISNISSCGYYIIYYFKRDFLYVSPNIAYWCGISSGKLKHLRFEQFINYVEQQDLIRLIEIHNEWFKMLKTTSIDERMKMSLIFDFRFTIDGKPDRMINHRVTPYSLKNGCVWLELCIVTMSSEEDNEYVMMKKGNSYSYYEYSFEHHNWNLNTINPLSATEYDILLLSARGLTIEAIADEVHKQPDTVRKYRQVILKKLRTSCFASAALRAMNYNLLQIKR